MSLNLNDQKSTSSAPRKDYGRIEDGTYPARVVSVVDLGVQHQKDWQNQKPLYHALDEKGSWLKNGNDFVLITEPNDQPDLKPQCMVTFEFPTERIEIGEEKESKPRWMSKEYTISTHEKAALMAMMKALAPNSTMLSDLINKPALVSVGSTSSGNAKITQVAAMMKGMSVAELENDSVWFDFDAPTLEAFNKLPAFVQKKIKEATNYEGSVVQKMLAGNVQQQSQSNYQSEPNDHEFDDEFIGDEPF